MSEIRALIVAMISQKGGVGKSTLAVNFSIRLAHDGRRAAIIDIDDEQYSSSRHLTRRVNNNLSPEVDFFTAKVDDVENLLLKIGSNYDLIFVESSGKVTKELRKAISLADFIIMPLQPAAIESDTIPDVETVIDNLIKEGLDLKEIPALIVPNRIAFHQRAGNLNFKNENNALIGLLKLEPELKYFKFTKNYIKDRPNLYTRAYELGKAIFELEPQEISSYNKKNAAKSILTGTKEFNKLFNEVIYGQ